MVSQNLLDPRAIGFGLIAAVLMVNGGKLAEARHSSVRRSPSQA